MEINDKEDIWQLGVTILFLKSGKHPFAVNMDADDLMAKLQPIAALTDGDVQAALLRAGVKSGSQLASFLSRCLAIEPAQRATAMELHASGWISGASATQFVRDGGAAMRDVSSTLTTIQSDIRDVHADVKDIKGQLTKVLSGIEAVQRTIVNLDASPIPLIFCIEITPRDPGRNR
jgi:serine/threonine protein kinase